MFFDSVTEINRLKTERNMLLSKWMWMLLQEMNSLRKGMSNI